MAQFDVHRNLGPQRQHIPYVVVVQSRRLDAYRRRVVVPLVLGTSAPAGEPSLNPRFVVEAVEVVLHPLEIVSVSLDRLGPCVASLAGEGDRIIAAIDVVISRGFG
jgi:toxin CcdB